MIGAGSQVDIESALRLASEAPWMSGAVALRNQTEALRHGGS